MTDDLTDSEPRLRVETHPGEPPTVELVGEVDPHTADLVADAMNGLIDAGATSVRIDGSRLDFIDSSGLRVLVEAHRRLGNERSALVLAHVSPTLRRLLEVTGLDEHVTVEPAAP